MKNYSILERDFINNNLLNNWKDLNVITDLSEINSADPVIMGGNLLRPEVRERLNLQKPTIFIHRGYLGNHLYKKRYWWRYSINGFANVKPLSIPYSRWSLLNLPKYAWKVKAVKNILIAPSKLTSLVWSNENGQEWAESLSKMFVGAHVKIRYKAPKSGMRWATLLDRKSVV